MYSKLKIDSSYKHLKNIRRIVQCRFVKLDSNFSINHTACPWSLELYYHLRLILRSAPRYVMFSRFSLVNPYPTPSGRMDVAAARRGRPSRKLSGNRLSQRVRVKHGSFSLPQPLPSTSYPRSPLMVFSFSTSSYFHVSTQCVAYEATNVGTLDETQTWEGEGERDSGRVAARLYASATLNHSLEITLTYG